MQILTRALLLLKNGLNVPVGRFQIGGVAVTATADDLNGAARSLNTQVALVNGAITIKRGVVVITKATAAAMTLANPVATDDDFKRLTIIAATAAAHTVDNSAGAGFNAGGAGADVGTFGGAKGDGIVLVAYQGVWYVESKTNVTLG